MRGWYALGNDKEAGKYSLVKFDNYESTVVINESYCRNPSCICTNFSLTFTAIDEQGNPRETLFSIRLDVDTWEIKDKDIKNKAINSEEMIKEFMDSLDDKLKTKYRYHFCKSKEHSGKNYLNYISRDIVDAALRGETISYSEIYGPRDTEKLFINFNEQDKYYVVDQYCMRPECLCNEVILCFYHVGAEKEAKEPAFVISLGISNLNYEITTNNHRRDEVESIVKYVLQNKYEILELLKKRYAEMKTAGREVIEQYTQKNNLPKKLIMKVGRNDFCPCGSGKKYKRCCGE